MTTTITPEQLRAALDGGDPEAVTMGIQLLNDIIAAADSVPGEYSVGGHWHWVGYRDDLAELETTPPGKKFGSSIIEAEHHGECGCRSECYLELNIDPAIRTYIQAVQPAFLRSMVALLTTVLTAPSFGSDAAFENAIEVLYSLCDSLISTEGSPS